MENTGNVPRRESRLAVFEHILEKGKDSKRKRYKTDRIDSEDSSPSELELVIDDEHERPIKKRKKNQLVRQSEEPLHLICEWANCSISFKSWSGLNDHILGHIKEVTPFVCQWTGCNLESRSSDIFRQHLSYHGYLSKVKNIGKNVVCRNNLPDCKQTENCVIPLSLEGYKCEWEYCRGHFWTIFEFLIHMQMHVNANPRIPKGKDMIICKWKGCGSKSGTRSRLGEHVRIHSKEKPIGCPKCCGLFSSKTRFSDHRIRQISTHLQSYQCSQCLKLFPNEHLLREHMRSHINHYKCNMCDMTCAKPSTLAKHIRFKHIKEKNFKCNECGKGFIEKHNLVTHLKTHKDGSWKCDHCDFQCNSKAGLDNHCRKKHEQPKLSYECHCCKKIFVRGSTLTKHLMKLHKYHWPSGHSRFRYRKDQDGIHRLQTVRYESLEVTEEMLKSESMPANSSDKKVSYSLEYDKQGMSGCVLSIKEKNDKTVENNEQEKDVVITINDVDEHGNILKSEVVQSKEIVVSNLKETDNDGRKVIVANNSLPNLNESSDDESRVDIKNHDVLQNISEDSSISNSSCFETSVTVKKEMVKDFNTLTEDETSIEITKDDIAYESENIGANKTRKKSTRKKRSKK